MCFKEIYTFTNTGPKEPCRPSEIMGAGLHVSTPADQLQCVCYGRRAPLQRFDTSEHISLALPAPIIIHFPLPKPLSRKYEILCLDCPLRSPSSLPKPGAERFVPFALPAPCHPSDIAETWFRNLHIIPFACSPPSRRPHRTQDSKCYKMDT